MLRFVIMMSLNEDTYNIRARWTHSYRLQFSS